MKLKRAPSAWLVVTCFALMFISSQEASAQICRPAVEWTGELGCWITVDAELGKLPHSWFREGTCRLTTACRGR